MSDDNLSKTMIIPNPGGRRTASGAGHDAEQAQQPPQTSSPQPSNRQPSHVSTQTAMPAFAGDLSQFGSAEGENIILTAGTEILTLAGNIKSLEPNNSIEQLRLDIDRLLLQFTNQITNASVAKEVVLTARYIICCLLDELVLSTPWGADSSWSQQTLLGKYHNETWGGEKFFLIINKLLEQPQRNINLIELCYVCLSIGFAGKYRVSQQGEQELMRVNQALYMHIEQARPIDRDLSPAWQGIGEKGQGLVKRFPSWVFFLILLFCLMGAYIGFLSSLKAKVEPIYQNLESIGWQDFVLKMNAKKPSTFDINKIADEFKIKFAKEIDQKIVAIDTKDGMLVVRFISTSLFKSGSSYVNEDALPDVNLLVNNIKEYADSVLVVGHTDDTGKADSNWVISRKRAEAIAKWLTKANVQLSNTITRGVADSQPLFANDSDYNRSLNRRVELLLVLKG